MTATIHPTAIVDASAVIGEGVTIGPWVYVGPNCTVGAGSVLAMCATLEANVRLRDLTVIHVEDLLDSLAGSGLAPGTIITVHNSLAAPETPVHTVIAGLGGRTITRASLHKAFAGAVAGTLEPVTFLDLDRVAVDRVQIGRAHV